jgi:hypothetical protein
MLEVISVMIFVVDATSTVLALPLWASVTEMVFPVGSIALIAPNTGTPPGACAKLGFGAATSAISTAAADAAAILCEVVIFIVFSPFIVIMEPEAILPIG